MSSTEEIQGLICSNLILLWRTSTRAVVCFASVDAGPDSKSTGDRYSWAEVKHQKYRTPNFLIRGFI